MGRKHGGNRTIGQGHKVFLCFLPIDYNNVIFIYNFYPLQLWVYWTVQYLIIPLVLPLNSVVNLLSGVAFKTEQVRRCRIVEHELFFSVRFRLGVLELFFLRNYLNKV